MGRLEQTEEVRQKVVAAARRLFLDKGYSQTTLREISTEASVSYGSIYHHFADKEGVFLELVLDGFEKTQETTDRSLAGSHDPYLRLGLKWAGLVRAASDDVHVAELLSVAYRSWKITEVLMKAATARHRDWLKSELPNWTENKFFAATLVLKGAVASVIEEKLNLDQLTAESRIDAVLSAALPCFGASAETTRKVLDKIPRLVGPLAKGALNEARGRRSSVQTKRHG